MPKLPFSSAAMYGIHMCMCQCTFVMTFFSAFTANIAFIEGKERKLPSAISFGVSCTYMCLNYISPVQPCAAHAHVCTQTHTMYSSIQHIPLLLFLCSLPYESKYAHTNPVTKFRYVPELMCYTSHCVCVCIVCVYCVCVCVCMCA